VGIGAYASAYLSTQIGLSPWLTLLIGLGGSPLQRTGHRFVTLRMSGHYLPLATIAWSIALVLLVRQHRSARQQDGISDCLHPAFSDSTWSRPGDVCPDLGPPSACRHGRF